MNLYGMAITDGLSPYSTIFEVFSRHLPTKHVIFWRSALIVSCYNGYVPPAFWIDFCILDNN